MVTRAEVGFVLLLAFLAFGAWVRRQQTSHRSWVRNAAGRVHRTVGVVALAVAVLLALTAARLLLG